MRSINFTFTRDVANSVGEVTSPTETAAPVTVVSKGGEIIGSGTVQNNVANTVTYILKVYYDNATYNQNNGEQREFSFHIGYSWKDSNDNTTVQP